MVLVGLVVQGCRGRRGFQLVQGFQGLQGFQEIHVDLQHQIHQVVQDYQLVQGYQALQVFQLRQVFLVGREVLSILGGLDDHGVQVQLAFRVGQVVR